MENVVSLGVGLLGVVVFLFLLLSSVFTVETQEVAIITYFSKYRRLANAGLNFKIPLIEGIAERISLRTQQETFTVETKTKDNVFVTMALSVQYLVPEDKVYDAFYKLDNPVEQIESFLSDSIRAIVAGKDLDEVFESQNQISESVKGVLETAMREFGYVIHAVLTTEIKVGDAVQTAMDGVMVAIRQRAAATEKAEADKVIRVKAAEADSEAQRLRGEGIASERKAIIEGLEHSVLEFQEATGINPGTILGLVMNTLHLDTQRDMARGSRATVIFTDGSPDAGQRFFQQFAGMFAGAEMNGARGSDAETNGQPTSNESEPANSSKAGESSS